MNSIKNRNEAQISISGSIYRYIKDGKTQVVIHDAEIIKGGDSNILKLCCYDQDGNYGEYSVFVNNNPSSIFAQLIRAITSREISQLKMSMLIGKQIYATIASKSGYSNMAEIKKVDRCDYFETKNLDDIEDDDAEDEEREYTSKERNLNKKTYRSKPHQRRRAQEDEDLEDTEEDDIEEDDIEEDDIEEDDAEEERVYTSKQRSPKKKPHQRRRTQEDDIEEDDIEEDDAEEDDAEEERVYTSKQRSPKKKPHQRRRTQED